MHAAGGPDDFLDQYAVIVTSDHSQAAVEERIRLDHAFAEFDVATRSAARSVGAEVALSPAQRAAMIYALDDERRDELVARSVEAACGLEGVDLALWLAGPDREEAVVRSRRGELRFAPGDDLTDARGNRWSVEGEPATLAISARDGRLGEDEYPDPLGRLWSALRCPFAGDVLVAAAPGYEFVDWGGVDHVPGGSHGSLHGADSLGVLLACGLELPERASWSIADVTPLVLSHFSVWS
jgi:hypothetical protein